MNKQEIKTALAPRAIGSYSQAVKVGNFIFCSGQIPLDAKSGELIVADITMQTIKVLDNLKEVLSAAHCSLEHVVKTTVFLKSLQDFSKVNEIYSQYFLSPYPARSTVQVAKLPMDASIEIEAVAFTD